MRGRLLTIAPANPAAGAEISVVVTAAKRWRLQSAFWQFVTSATVVNRIVEIKLTDPAGRLCWLSASTRFGSTTADVNTHAASLTGFYSSAPGAPNAAANETGYLMFSNFLPGWELAPGSTLFTFTRQIQVGDQYSNISLLVEEWDA